MHLVQTARRVRTISSVDETRALLLENSLIREFLPRYHSANAKLESYHSLGLGLFKEGNLTSVRIRLTEDPKAQDDRIFGAFKNRGTLQKIYSAILRALCKLPPERGDRAEYPHSLLTSRPPAKFELTLTRAHADAFLRFTEGAPAEFLHDFQPEEGDLIRLTFTKPGE
ncbi:MAG: hypothetical protein H7301_12110 [Cryobacterium sp.]|nr:hypothetical protein [Oligoflexia bacterium]